MVPLNLSMDLTMCTLLCIHLYFYLPSTIHATSSNPSSSSPIFALQNASDVLSSAAFMNLAAAFPGARSRAFLAANRAMLVVSSAHTTACNNTVLEADGHLTTAAAAAYDSRAMISDVEYIKTGVFSLQGRDSDLAAAKTCENVAAVRSSYESYWIPEGEDIVDWEAVRTAPDEVVAELIQCRWVTCCWAL